ncbi:MAG: M1 family metallopeptidase [Deltaproteobacteria bacterium]|nr:M1 family metallopeptidase [Deltaproteobacteria bacterium]
MEHRLPTIATPRRYDLRIEPDLDRGTFAGSESVVVAVAEPVSELVMNSAGLAVRDASVRGASGHVPAAGIVEDADAERITIRFAAPLAPGEWTLRLSFAGAFSKDLHGFYASTWTDESGRDHPLAATQFESTYARRAFPCWDEPAFKAVFGVTLVVPDGLAAISNAAIASEAPAGPGRRAVTFADTIPMSTYLVAFLVGRLVSTEPAMVGSTPVRVWSVPPKARLAPYALGVAAFSLDFFERWYGIPYPGGKLDLVAVPDFASGAMENLGAVTFRETALLVDEATATHGEQERVADVVAHEIAHMWFGDLVTMGWWNGIWLNEAFATFMEMLAVDAWRPQWRRWDSFAVSRAGALLVDGLRSSRPIEFPVAAPRDCDAMFEGLTYDKGAAVLRMFERHLGEDTFRAGVRTYLDRHRLANTETGDLWRALGEAAGVPITAMMDGWVFRPGYPLVEVREAPGGVELEQRRFLYLADEADGANAERWHVPVAIRGSAAGRPFESRVMLSADRACVSLPGQIDWVVANAGGHGFYRAGYSPALFEKVGAAMPSLEPSERFCVASDAFALVQSGAAELAPFLDATALFRDEDDRNVWSAVVGSLAYLYRLVPDEDRPGIEALVRDRLGRAFGRMGWVPRPGEDEVRRGLRGDLLRALGTLGNDAEIQARSRDVLARPEAHDPDVVASCVPVVARCGGEREYEEFLRRVRESRSPQDEHRYLFGLAGFRPPALVERTLASCLGGAVRSQDAPYVLRSMLASVAARRAAWRFLTARWDEIRAAWPSNAVRRMLEGVAWLVEPDLEDEVEAFFRSGRVELGTRVADQYLEQLRVAVRLRTRAGGALSAYLRDPT